MAVTVWHNGAIWIDQNTRANALAARDGVVVAHGREATSLIATADEVVDLQGATLTPGFGDGHAHPVFGGIETLFAPVRGPETLDELLATAFEALGAGADAVITARRLDAVRLLAAECVPVMGHLGFVPKKSTQYGGVRAVGNTAAEALDLWRQFRELEEAGAFAVECELIPAAVLAEITPRTSMATISLGSGPEADVMFLFQSDVVGSSERIPRHARAYGASRSFKMASSSWRTCARSCSALRGLSPA